MAVKLTSRTQTSINKCLLVPLPLGWGWGSLQYSGMWVSIFSVSEITWAKTQTGNYEVLTPDCLYWDFPSIPNQTFSVVYRHLRLYNSYLYRKWSQRSSFSYFTRTLTVLWFSSPSTACKTTWKRKRTEPAEQTPGESQVLEDAANYFQANMKCLDLFLVTTTLWLLVKMCENTVGSKRIWRKTPFSILSFCVSQQWIWNQFTETQVNTSIRGKSVVDVL